jgi:hypothetical protein
VKKLFILRKPVHHANLLAALANNWQAAAAAGVPLGVHVAPYRKTRSNEQNALL